MHTHFASRGTVVIHAFAFALFLFVAALLWLLRPRALLTFRVGIVALLGSIVWGVLTTDTVYRLREQAPQAAPMWVGSLLLDLGLVWLTYRYIFGTPSRQYFRPT